jgi:hypothetical protein
MLSRLILTICLLLPWKVFSQEIQFYRENLTFRIEDSCFMMSGLYYLRNLGDTSREIDLFYPLPHDSLHGSVDSILLFSVDTNEEITDFRRTKKGLLFTTKVDSTASLHISYRQKLLGSKARYILTTTKHWQQPLEKAEYHLIVPGNIRITSFSYPPDEKEETGMYIIYRWQREYFIPDRDMVFSFQHKK